jgi:hypothetical protein
MTEVILSLVFLNDNKNMFFLVFFGKKLCIKNCVDDFFMVHPFVSALSPIPLLTVLNAA